MAGQIAGLVSKEEICRRILKDLCYCAAKKIQEEASRWRRSCKMTKTAFLLPVKVLSI